MADRPKAFDVDGALAAGYTEREIVDHLAKETGLRADQARAAGYSDKELLVHLLGNNPETGGPRTAGTTPMRSQEEETLRQRRVEKARQQSAIDQEVDKVEYDPARNGTTLQNLAAGFGKSFVDVGRGARQIGASVADVVAPRATTVADLVAGRDPSRAAAVQREVDAAREADKPLMRTGAGFGGNLSGTVAQTLPLMMIPGAQTIPGSAAIGAGVGAVQPTATGESRALNTVFGATAGAAGPLIARGVGAGIRAGKALIEPFTEGGRQRIAGRVLQNFGVEPGDLAGVSNAPTATGARLTLPEQIQRPEGAAAAARLMDDLRAQNPELAAQIAAREGENNAARVGTLQRLSAGRDAAADARAQATGGLYQGANAGTFQPTQEFVKLAERPIIKSALAKAQSNLADAGGQAAPNSIELLHQTKLALDDAIAAIKAGKPSAATGAEIAAATKAQKDLLKFIESQSPDYAKARSTYAAMSKPVNQADIADELLRRGSANTTDLSGTPRLMPNALTGAVRDQGKLIKQATGRDLGQNLADVLEPDQLAAINAVVGEVDRGAAVARAANGPGSATAKRIAGSNVIQQTLERAGLPDGAANSVTVQEILARPLNFLYKGAAEPKLQMTLGELLLDPSKASRAMMAASPSQRTALANVLGNRYLRQAARQALPASVEANRR